MGKTKHLDILSNPFLPDLMAEPLNRMPGESPESWFRRLHERDPYRKNEIDAVLEDADAYMDWLLKLTPEEYDRCLREQGLL